MRHGADVVLQMIIFSPFTIVFGGVGSIHLSSAVSRSPTQDWMVFRRRWSWQLSISHKGQKKHSLPRSQTSLLFQFMRLSGMFCNLKIGLGKLVCNHRGFPIHAMRRLSQANLVSVSARLHIYSLILNYWI